MERWRGPSDEEFREEIEAHVALETDRLIAEGLSPEDAAIAARRPFGNVTRVRERYYESRRVMWLVDAWQDARFAFRSLKRSPGFSAVALLTLALGLGASTAIFSVVNAVLLRPLPYSDPDQLILLEHPGLGGSPAWLRDAWRARARTLADFAGVDRSGPGTLVTGNRPIQVHAARVTSNFFPLLGVTPVLGRTFSTADAEPGAPAVAVLSHHFWVRQFGGSPDALGKTITLTDVATANDVLVIVGVLRSDFRFPIAEPRGYTPLFARMQPDVLLLSQDDARQQVIGRLPPDGTLAAATAELSLIFKQEASGHVEARFVEGTPVVTTPLQQRLAGDSRHRLLLLTAAVGCVLLLVCATVANLLLGRVYTRQTEFAVRAALGARTGRLIRLILTESLLLAALGSVGALLLAYLVSGSLRSVLASRVSYVEHIPFDWSVLGFSAVVAMAAGVVTGMTALAAIRFKNLAEARLAAGRSVTGRTRLGRALLAAQVAAAFVLLLAAVLLSQTLWNLYHAKRGFDGDGLLGVAVMPSLSGTISEIQSLASVFFERVTDRIGRIPEVESLAAASTVPFSGLLLTARASVIGNPSNTGNGASVSAVVVTPGYFPLMRMRMLAGRDFSRLDSADGERVAVVNEALLRALGSDRPLLGAQIQLGPYPRTDPLTVVGIVEDTPDTSLREPARPLVYIPLAQSIGTGFAFGRFTILVRGRSGHPMALVPAVRDAVWALGHDIVIDEVATMDERLAAATRAERENAALFGLLAAVALLMAVAGVYGLVAYSVTQRTREIGIRIALGARQRQVVRDVVRESVWPLAIGIGLGVVGAIVAVNAIASVLFGIHPTDPPTYMATALALALTALTAAWLPARRAARVDPVTALRAE